MTYRDSTVRLPSWLIAASLAVVVIATLTYFITTSNDNTDEATPPPDPASSSTPAPSEHESKAPDAAAEKTKKATDKPKQQKSAAPDKPKDTKQSEKPQKKKQQQKKKPTVTADATVDVYNNAGITNLAASASSNVRSAGFTVGGVDNWYGAIPSTTVYYPPGMEEQAKLLADNLGVGRMLPAVAPMAGDRLSLILTAAI